MAKAEPEWITSKEAAALVDHGRSEVRERTSTRLDC